MPDKHYVPILKWKEGERRALRELTEEATDLLCPLVLVMAGNNPNTFITQINQCWGNQQPLYVDFHHNFRNRLDGFLQSLLEEPRMNFIPIISTNKDNNFLQIINDNIRSFNSGIAIRITTRDFDNILSHIESLLQRTNATPSNSNLIIDLGQIPSEDVIGTLCIVTRNILSQIQELGFRNIILSGSSFPESLHVRQNTISAITRLEFEIWALLREEYPNLGFGDYAADDPQDIAYDFAPVMIPTIRYTHQNNWYIIRGSYDPNRPHDYSQYHHLSSMLVNNAIYCGPDYSWGDSRIRECANRACTGSDRCNHGNLRSWVPIYTNHHLTYVGRQIANLFSVSSTS